MKFFNNGENVNVNGQNFFNDLYSNNEIENYNHYDVPNFQERIYVDQLANNFINWKGYYGRDIGNDLLQNDMLYCNQNAFYDEIEQQYNHQVNDMDCDFVWHSSVKDLNFDDNENDLDDKNSLYSNFNTTENNNFFKMYNTDDSYDNQVHFSSETNQALCPNFNMTFNEKLIHDYVFGIFQDELVNMERVEQEDTIQNTIKSETEKEIQTKTKRLYNYKERRKKIKLSNLPRAENTSISTGIALKEILMPISTYSRKILYEDNSINNILPERKKYIYKKKLKKYICPFLGCENVYTSSNGLKYHMDRGHCKDLGIEKPYICDIEGCDKKYKNINGLTFHRFNKHKQATVDNKE